MAPEYVTRAGRFYGEIDDDVVRISGIRYACAERFQVPEQVQSTSVASEQNISTSGPIPPQLSSRLLETLIEHTIQGRESSEDCLVLSIVLPFHASTSRLLPVMVWFHGGGYATGAGDLEIYDPRSIVAEQNVLVVNVTSRLGMLGYLGDGVTLKANLGLLDQREALRWIHDNIAHFGGDPANVTLFGQSAGADAIAHLMIADGTEGLFQRAILQSAPLGLARNRAKMAKKLVDAAGMLTPSLAVEDVLKRQRFVERRALRFGLRGAMPFGVLYGQPPLPPQRQCADAWRAIAPEIDVLIGTNSAETAIYLPAAKGTRLSKRAKALDSILHFLVVRPTTYLLYLAPAKRFFRRHKRAGGNATRYMIDKVASGIAVGPAHMTEVPLLLGTRGAWQRTSLLAGADWESVGELGSQLRKAWADFARTGRVVADTHEEVSVLRILNR